MQRQGAPGRGAAPRAGPPDARALAHGHGDAQQRRPAGAAWHARELQTYSNHHSFSNKV